jgi:hypothetical protein
MSAILVFKQGYEKFFKKITIIIFRLGEESIIALDYSIAVSEKFL